ncbi:MAG: hypothetical protein RIC51_10105, partial [Erythrobacter sp.]
MMKPAWLTVLAPLLMAGTTCAEEPLETRLALEGEPPPAATLAQVDWLVGQWKGTGIGGAPAQENWLPPA